VINRNGVHLPDTTYGGNPIDWNCSSDSDDSQQRLKAENAKLREEIAKWERLAAGIDLPDYPVTQFKPKDLERENAKLLKQVVRCRDCKHYSDHEWVIATDVSDVCHFWADGVKVEPDGFCKWGERKEE